MALLSFEDRGTERLFEHQFSHPDKLAKFAVVAHGQQGAKEPVSPEYPLYLTTGRVMAHYQTGVQTRKSTSLVARQFEAYVELHPDTAEAYGISARGTRHHPVKRVCHHEVPHNRYHPKRYCVCSVSLE